jgi:hypothetical protein
MRHLDGLERQARPPTTSSRLDRDELEMVQAPMPSLQDGDRLRRGIQGQRRQVALAPPATKRGDALGRVAVGVGEQDGSRRSTSAKL